MIYSVSVSCCWLFLIVHFYKKFLSATTKVGKALSKTGVRQSACPSYASSSKMAYFWDRLLYNTDRKSHLEVEPTNQCGIQQKWPNSLEAKNLPQCVITTVKHYFRCILIMRFCYVDLCILIRCVFQVLIFYAVMVMGKLHKLVYIYNFEILLVQSLKFDAREI